MNYNDTAKLLTELKNTDEFTWLNEVNSQSMQQTLRQLDNAYGYFFKKKSKYPRFKKKGNKNSFTVPQHIAVRDGKLFIPKFKTGIDINVHREIDGDICYATINRTVCGNYYCSLTVEFVPTELPKTGSEVGIDLGIKDFAIMSDGNKIDNPRHFVSRQSKLAFQQKALAKVKNKQSSTYKFRKFRVAQLHELISNQRKDFLHKHSIEIIKNHDIICIESLNVKGMIRNQCLAKHIADVGWGMFANYLRYKAGWYGKILVEIDRFFPSSQICSECDYQNRELKLSDREWVCIGCGCVHDRDVNAAKNIKRQGLKLLMSGSWADSDSKQKRSEPLPNARLRKRKPVGEAVITKAPESSAQG